MQAPDVDDFTAEETERFQRFMQLRASAQRLRAWLNKYTRPIWKRMSKSDIAAVYAAKATYDGAVALPEEVYEKILGHCGIMVPQSNTIIFGQAAEQEEA